MRGVISFEALSDVCQRHSKSLDSRKGVLEVQDVGVAINPAKLHYLQSKIIQKGPVNNNAN